MNERVEQAGNGHQVKGTLFVRSMALAHTAASTPAFTNRTLASPSATPSPDG